MNQYLCLKDWVLNGKVIFKKGDLYKGTKKTKNKNYVDIKPPKGTKITFHPGSEYFNID